MSVLQYLFPPLPPQTRRLLEGIPPLIEKTFPIPARFARALPANVAELSRLLTSGRGERELSYIGRPSLLSAYLHYFLPWNLYRLCRLLPGLDINLHANDSVTDLGCGPLTFVSALWICRPELRAVPLEFYCVDRSGPALDAGKKFFNALARPPSGENCPWKIITAKGDITAVNSRHSTLVCGVNVFNEMYGDISRNGPDSLYRNAGKAARLLKSHGHERSLFLVIEPGFPRCGEFISLLRGAFAEYGIRPLSPCPHGEDCPAAGGMSETGKKRWCHFAFETSGVPSALRRLSRAAGIPKERAVLSFLLAGAAEGQTAKASPAKQNAATGGLTELRVISDAFSLPGEKHGLYCCSRRGLILLAGKKNAIEKISSGDTVAAAVKKGEKDPKSGAVMAELLLPQKSDKITL
jgi:hypothetical protein